MPTFSVSRADSNREQQPESSQENVAATSSSGKNMVVYSTDQWKKG